MDLAGRSEYEKHNAACRKQRGIPDAARRSLILVCCCHSTPRFDAAKSVRAL
jgi:hypothetical protein